MSFVCWSCHIIRCFFWKYILYSYLGDFHLEHLRYSTPQAQNQQRKSKLLYDLLRFYCTVTFFVAKAAFSEGLVCRPRTSLRLPHFSTVTIRFKNHKEITTIYAWVTRNNGQFHNSYLSEIRHWCVTSTNATSRGHGLQNETQLSVWMFTCLFVSNSYYSR